MGEFPFGPFAIPRNNEYQGPVYDTCHLKRRRILSLAHQYQAREAKKVEGTKGVKYVTRQRKRNPVPPRGTGFFYERK